MTDVSTKFRQNNVAIMRHARYNEHDESIPDRGKEECRQVITELFAKIGHKNIIILHSPRIRAKNTAHIVTEILTDLGAKLIAPPESIALLDCDHHSIDMAINSVADNQDEFTLLISHQPDIQRFLDVFSGVSNCSIFSQEFVIQ